MFAAELCKDTTSVAWPEAGVAQKNEVEIEKNTVVPLHDKHFIPLATAISHLNVVRRISY